MIIFFLVLYLVFLTESLTPPYEDFNFSKSLKSEHVVFPFPVSPSSKYTHIEVKYASHQLLTGSLYIFENPEQWHIFPSPQGCPGKNTTSNSAKYHHCDIAMNAGFFNVPTGGCIGNVVSNGKWIQKHANGNANFGFIVDPSDKRKKFITGYLDEKDLENYHFNQLVTGVLWLVKDGKSFVNSSIVIEKANWHFCEEAAQRVSVGHDKHGRLLMLQINGIEVQNYGPNVWDIAEIMLYYGAVNAINLDGGGSATTVDHGKILSECTDGCTPTTTQDQCPNGKCERRVTTVQCAQVN